MLSQETRDACKQIVKNFKLMAPQETTPDKLCKALYDYASFVNGIDEMVECVKEEYVALSS